ncbi:MAG: PQQ-dependent sugar dehydrogenase [Phycisphaerae bacterium]|nr:PQQ-dependent sugar dehydrogenase [Phycisphaerae bacterium]MCZ2399116.1 PQQ-dependent sugar dehydrogenase [Phycisphaerae bacterium]NUQ48935.1 PQQ-dependent sugar dehydrogenase [Phycisphaerae bacterium]
MVSSVMLSDSETPASGPPSRDGSGKALRPLGRCAVLAAGLGLAFAFTAAAQDIPPEDFERSLYAAGLSQPVALAVAPDGRLFITEKAGTIRIVEDGVLRPEPFAVLTVHTDSENGLLGIAIDPNFARNGYVYAFASVSPVEQRIFRFTDARGIGVDQTVIRDKPPTTGTIHSGGGLGFGADGKLYFSIGDNGIASNAQDLGTLSGKLCRINPDGSTPEDNPFRTPTGTPRAIYALGLRNPFRFCFAPDGRAFVLDVGSDGGARREEINVVYAGDNCGWPLYEGYSVLGSIAGYREPVFAYHEQGQAVTGAVYYTGRQFPAQMIGNLLHLEFVLNRLYRLELNGDRVTRHSLLLELDGGPVDLVQDLDGSLLYSEFHTGRIVRIRYVGPLPPAPEPPSDEPAGAPAVSGINAAAPCGLGALPAMLLVTGALSARRRPGG